MGLLMKQKNLIIRQATTSEDLAEALRIREVVFIQEQQVPAEIERDEWDATAIHLLAVVGNHDGEMVVGTARLVDKGKGTAKIGRVAVLPAFRGEGVGKQLMEAVFEVATTAGFTQVLLDAQVQVVSFYKQLDFQPEGETFWEAGILHQRMTRTLPLSPLVNPSTLPGSEN
jgi:putative N-acetyltransferase (TIGR04045 family)